MKLRGKKKVLEFPLTLTGCITVHCIRFVWVNRPSLTCMLVKLCLSAVNDSCVFETFGLTKKCF